MYYILNRETKGETVMWIIPIVIFIFVIVFKSLNAYDRVSQGNLKPTKFQHIEGIPSLREGEIVNISSEDNSITIDNKLYIPKESVISKEVTTSTMLTEKQKSVVKRALVGVALGGAVGAVVGGLSGVGSKQTTEEVLFFTLCFKDEEGIEHRGLFALMDKDTNATIDIFAKSKPK